LLHEVEFWERWLATEDGLKWQHECQDPQRLLQDYLLKDRMDDVQCEVVWILDVGAGPVTSLGYTYPGKVLKITAIDPLSKEYNLILAAAQIRPPIRTTCCPGEQILDKYERDTFDFAYASNSLDHSYDPLLVIRNMLAVVKKGGFVLLRHYKNEGKIENYMGLHQWNFDRRENDFIIWNEESERNVTHILQDEAQVECYYESSSIYGGWEHSDWVVCVIKKL